MYKGVSHWGGADILELWTTQGGMVSDCLVSFLFEEWGGEWTMIQRKKLKKKKKPPAILSLQTFNYSGAEDPSSTLSIISNFLYPCSEPLRDFRVADQSTSLRDGEPGNAREGGEVTRLLT